tara:strand:- start:700 stop:1086 length:387 start_codon:yes stop_codon:yes gene_type:complete
MATEILINDGGAPARIYPFVAAATIVAGNALKCDSAGKAALATAGNAGLLGIALNAAATGEMVNVIAGRGVIVNILCKDEAAGADMMVDTSGSPGHLDGFAGGTDSVICATTLENNSGDDVLTKCILL